MARCSCGGDSLRRVLRVGDTVVLTGRSGAETACARKVKAVEPIAAGLWHVKVDGGRVCPKCRVTPSRPLCTIVRADLTGRPWGLVVVRRGRG